MAPLKNPAEADLPGLVAVYEAAETACVRDAFERATSALEALGTREAEEAIALLDAIPGAMIELVAARMGRTNASR